LETEIVKLILPVTSNRDHIQGSSNAPVTLVEYGDYECPYCGQAYPMIKKVKRHLGNKLRFVFRNFPLTEIHPHAQHAAEAAEAAGVQDRFWEMHDYLYEHQQALDDKYLEKYANNLRLDLSKFNIDMSSHVHAGRIRRRFPKWCTKRCKWYTNLLHQLNTLRWFVGFRNSFESPQICRQYPITIDR